MKVYIQFYVLTSKGLIRFWNWIMIQNDCSTEYTECQAFCPVVRMGSHPLTRKLVLSPLWIDLRGKHSLAGEGVGGPNSDERTDTLVLYIYYNHSTDYSHDPICEEKIFWI
jgi:hypothetical protein